MKGLQENASACCPAFLLFRVETFSAFPTRQIHWLPSSSWIFAKPWMRYRSQSALWWLARAAAPIASKSCPRLPASLTTASSAGSTPPQTSGSTRSCPWLESHRIGRMPMPLLIEQHWVLKGWRLPEPACTDSQDGEGNDERQLADPQKKDPVQNRPREVDHPDHAIPPRRLARLVGLAES